LCPKWKDYNFATTFGSAVMIATLDRQGLVIPNSIFTIYTGYWRQERNQKSALPFLFKSIKTTE